MKKHIDIIERMMFAFPNVLVDGRRIYPTLKAAKEAFEKQIPKKVTAIHTMLSKAICPKCERLIDAYANKYCRHCGQALDWRDTE